MNIQDKNHQLHKIRKVIGKKEDNFKGVLYKNPIMIEKYKQLRQGANDIFISNGDYLVSSSRNMFASL